MIQLTLWPAVGRARLQQLPALGVRVPDGRPVVGARRLTGLRALGTSGHPKGRRKAPAIRRDRMIDDDGVEREQRPSRDAALLAQLFAAPVEEVDVAPAPDGRDHALVRVRRRAVGVAWRAVLGDRALALAVRLGEPHVPALDVDDAACLDASDTGQGQENGHNHDVNGTPPSHRRKRSQGPRRVATHLGVGCVDRFDCHQQPRIAGGFSEYRHGDSNPGFRRERAAS